jgi:hypothetical protein
MPSDGGPRFRSCQLTRTFLLLGLRPRAASCGERPSMDTTSCSSERRCRRRTCDHCGPIRRDDEFRKFHTNIREYGGRIVLVAVTAPGTDALPWDVDVCCEMGPHRHSGPFGCRVVRDLADEWNVDASERYARMWKAATINADRWVRRVHPGIKRLPRRVAVVWSEQSRGVWHVHEALPAATHVERQWSKLVVSYVDRNSRRYGWGFIDRNPLGKAARTYAGGSELAAAIYLARNAAAYLSENTAEMASAGGLQGRTLRSYVSRRLTSRTGATMRNLRRVRFLYVCLRLGLQLPEWGDDQLEVVWRLLIGAEVAPAGP